MALTTLGAVKTQLGITDSGADALISQLLPQADRLIKNWCHQELEAGTYTEYYDGRNRDRIVLNQGPVGSVINVWVDPSAWYSTQNAFASPTLLIQGVDYVLPPDQPDGVSSKSRILQRVSAVWPARRERTVGLVYQAIVPGRGTVKVVYAAGYAQVPADLAWCASMVVANMVDLKRGVRLASESHEDYSYSIAQARPGAGADALEPVKPYLAHYRILSLGGGF